MEDFWKYSMNRKNIISCKVDDKFLFHIYSYSYLCTCIFIHRYWNNPMIISGRPNKNVKKLYKHRFWNTLFSIYVAERFCPDFYSSDEIRSYLNSQAIKFGESLVLWFQIGFYFKNCFLVFNLFFWKKVSWKNSVQKHKFLVSVCNNL